MCSSSIVQKIWSFCDVLKDDGVGYGDYLEQLTYLLFLKMVDEYEKPPYNRNLKIPSGFGWGSLTSKTGAALENHYNNLLRQLGRRKKGVIGNIFIKGQNKIQDPAKLYKLIHMIGKENWVSMGVKDKGVIYEEILEKHVEDSKGGAGQYFTPRALIQTIVECIRPKPMKTIGDPSLGTGGFF